MPKLEKNSIHTVIIEGYSSTGQGIARLDGMAVFVRGALRGERCQISLLKVGKTCAWARLLNVLAPSPARIEPDCPYYPACGGCSMRHMSYEEELECKRQRINDALKHIVAWTFPFTQSTVPPRQSATATKLLFPSVKTIKPV